MSGATIRLDKWLWHARFVRRRSAAAELVEAGRVRVNGAVVDRPGRAIRTGDVLTIGVGGRVFLVRVLELGARRGGPAEAQALYELLEGSDPRT